MDQRKLLVARGYDSNRYIDLVRAMSGSGVRRRYLDVLSEGLPDGARVLELGCGTGEPMTQALAQGFSVVGLDISERQLARARQNAPPVSFLRADMVRLPFAAEQFDAVAAFYSPTHVPRDEHPALLAEIHRVLRIGGLLVITMGSRDNPDGYEQDWLGAPMFFSHYDGDTNTVLVSGAGFEVISSRDEVEDEYGVPVSFRWIVARQQ